MRRSSKKWSFRRWRRRWSERFDRLQLRWRIWFDRHVVSHDTRRSWRRRWRRRSEKLERSVESVGFKILPHSPEAKPDTWWTRFKERAQQFIDRKAYPVETRLRHGRILSRFWREFAGPFQDGSERVSNWLENHVTPALTPAGFKRKFFNWKGAVAGVLIAGLVAGIPLWAIPAWKNHNEQKWAAQARLLFSRGYYGLAYQNAARVLRHNQEQTEASRVLADLQERQGLPDAIAWRQTVVRNDGSISSQLALAETAVKIEPPPSSTAAAVFAKLPPEATNSVQYHTVVAQFETRNGSFAKAESHYLSALQQSPDNPELTLALALVRLQMRDAELVAAGEKSLIYLASNTNMVVQALRPLVMLNANRGDYAQSLKYSTQIIASESPTLEDRLAHVGLLFQMRDPRRQNYLETLQAQVSANPLFVAQVAGWMTANRMSQETLAWIATLPTPIRTADVVLMAQSDAYIARGDWAGLDRFLLARPWGTVEYARQVMLSKAHRGLRQQRAATSYFQRSKELASGMSLRLINLTKLVNSWGWGPETDELLWEIFDRYPEVKWAEESLLARYGQGGNTDGLRQMFELQLSRAPDDPYVKNNLAMVLLLLKRDLPKAFELARQAHQQVPDSVPNLTTYAFSLFSQGRTQESFQLMKSIDSEQLKSPSIAAYYVIISEASGDRKGAEHYLAYALQARLLPEENALLDRARSRL